MNDPGLDVQLRNKPPRNRCPYCHEGVEPEACVVCQGCLARHHSPCWDDHGACASCGEATSLAPRQSGAVAALVRSPLVERPRPLSGSTVRVEDLPGGAIRLAFPGVRNTAGNRPAGAAMYLGLLLGIVALLVGGICLTDKTTESLGLAFCAAAFHLALLAAWGWSGVQREADEPLETFVDLYPDRVAVEVPHRWRWGKLRPVEARREDVGNVQLVNGLLTLDLGALRLPLGTSDGMLECKLTTPEKEWLRGVLARWRNGAPPLEKGA